MTTVARTGRVDGRTAGHVVVLARRNLLRNIRYPDLLLLSTLQPIIFMLMFLYVFGGAIEAVLPPAAAGSYVNWLVPGIIAQTALFGAAQTAFGMNDDRGKGILDRYRSLPASGASVLLGRTLSDLVRNAFILLLQLGVGMVLGFHWSTGAVGLVAAMLLALAFGYACSWALVNLGLRVRSPEAIQAGVFMVALPLTLTSSAFLPTSTMPDWLRVFADHQPVTAMSDALRGLVLGAGALDPGQSVAGAVGIASAWIGLILVIGAPLAVRAYRRLD